MQGLSAKRRDLKVSELRLRLPRAHAGPPADRPPAVVGVVDDQLIVEPDLNTPPFTAGPDAIPAAGLDATVATPSDGGPAALAPDATFELMADVAPTAEVGPVEFPVVQGPHENEETLISAGLAGFNGELIVRPPGIAEEQSHVVRPAFLRDAAVLLRPDDAGRTALEAAVPDQLAPQPAVAGVVDVFEEMTVDLLVDAVEHAIGMDGQRDLGRAGRGQE